MRFHIPVILATVFLTACNQTIKEPDFKVSYSEVANLGDWTPEDVIVEGSTQGLIVRGSTCLVFHDEGQLVIFDLSKKSFVSTYKLTDNATHCNNASLGAEKWCEESILPLVYVSACTYDRACYVHDVYEDHADLVQKIYYDDDEQYPGFDWFVDVENRLLYLYGAAGDHYDMREFLLPDPHSAAEVHLHESDMIKLREVDKIGINQGSCVKGRYAYLPEGYDPYPRELNIYDMDRGTTVWEMDVTELAFEPEGICWNGDDLYVSFNMPEERETVLWKFNITE